MDILWFRSAKLTSVLCQVYLHTAKPPPSGLHPLPGLFGGAGGGSTKHSVVPDNGPQAGSAAVHGSLHSLPVPSDRAGPVGRSPSGHSHSVGAGGSALQDQSGTRTGAQIIVPSLENLCGIFRSSAAVLRFLQ